MMVVPTHRSQRPTRRCLSILAEGPWLKFKAPCHARTHGGLCEFCHARMHVHMAVFLLLDACMGHGVDEAAGSCGLADGLRPCGAWLGGLSM